MSVPPSEFMCPITYELMADPVVLDDGQTYERSAIAAWLQTHRTSPLTNRSVSGTMNPNYALRAAIERWVATAPVATGPITRAEKTFKVNSLDGGFVQVSCDQTTPVDTAIIAVIDNSGSMGEASAKPGGGAAAEANLFSRLDLVKHSLRTVAALAAESNAALGMVKFSSDAKVTFPVRKMDVAGVAEATKAIDALIPEGATNVWAGLRHALRQAKLYATANPDTNIHIILLTDGEPTPDYLPIQGLRTALNAQLTKLGTPVTISSFGFGYSLDSKLLEEVCVEGNGTYGYIPDCSMVGTVFINYCAAVFTTAASHVSLNGTYVGHIPIGRHRTAAITVAPGDAVELTYGGGATAKVVATASADDDAMANAKVISHLQSIIATASTSRTFADSTTAFKAAYEWVGDHDGGFRSAIMADILHTDDNKGQLSKAVSNKEWYGSWGLNHLISYARALANEQCVNFKDGALQFFATPAFRKVQAKGNEVFDDLPTPTASRAAYYGAASTISLGNFNMATFNTAAGGCWTGDAMVKMAGGSYKQTATLQPNDQVAGGHRIICIVRTEVNRTVKMCRLSNGLLITPWHPVKVAPQMDWAFPAHIYVTQGKPQPDEIYVDYFYNLVLSTGHTVEIDGFTVCTLAHGFQGPVISHPLYGTQFILNQLTQESGWDNGYVTLSFQKSLAV